NKEFEGKPIALRAKLVKVKPGKIFAHKYLDYTLCEFVWPNGPQLKVWGGVAVQMSERATSFSGLTEADFERLKEKVGEIVELTGVIGSVRFESPFGGNDPYFYLGVADQVFGNFRDDPNVAFSWDRFKQIMDRTKTPRGAVPPPEVLYFS